MNNNTNFFREGKGPAAVLKHGVLRRYLGTFAGSVSSTSPGHRVGYLDGYAGEGEYVNPLTGTTSDGSPRIALSIAADLRRQDRELHTVFVEKKRDAFRALARVVESANDPHARALQGDISSHLADALASFDNMPALVFLDPFGSALDHATTVNAILRRSGQWPTELLLNFSLQALRRMGARLWEPEGRAGREATLARVDTWLGGDWWREHFCSTEILEMPKSERANEAAMRVARLHAKKIQDATGCSRFAVLIRRSPTEKPLFVLILFYPRQLAGPKFNEAVSMALQDWRAFLHDVELSRADLDDDHDPEPFIANLSRVELAKLEFDADEKALNRDAIDAIKHSISSALLTKQSLSVRNDFAQVMGAGIGVGRTTHLRKAWSELANEGVVERCPKGPLDAQRITRAQRT